jgi:hypothetical protein
MLRESCIAENRAAENLLLFNKTVLINKLAIQIIKKEGREGRRRRSCRNRRKEGTEVSHGKGYGGIDWNNFVSCILWRSVLNKVINIWVQ